MQKYLINSDGAYEMLSEGEDIPQLSELKMLSDGKIDYVGTIRNIYNKYISIYDMKKEYKANSVEDFEKKFLTRYFSRKSGHFVFTKRIERVRDWDYTLNGKPASKVTISLLMNNAEDELAVALTILRGLSDIKIPDKLQTFKDYIKPSWYGGKAAVDAFLRNIRFITTEKKKPGGRGRPKKSSIMYKNPLTGRFIHQGKAAWKKIMKTIILKKVVYKKLSDIDIIDYNIEKKGNCVKSFIKSEYGERYSSGLPEDPKYPDVINAVKKIVNVYVYDRAGNVIDYSESFKKQDLHFMIHNNHMYVIDPVEEKRSGAVILKNYRGMRAETDINRINEHDNKTIIILDENRFGKILKYVKDNYAAGSYSGSCIKLGSNEIRYDPRYETYMKYIELYNSKAFTLFNLMNGLFKLTGCMNKETFEIMSNEHHIHITSHVDKNGETIRFDRNKSYPSALYDYKIPIPDINDFVVEYDRDEDIEDTWFYYCVLEHSHPIIATMHGFYYGYLVKEMQKYDEKSDKKIIKTIKYVLKCSSYEEVSEELLPNKDGTNRNNGKNFTFDNIREYIGWLRQCVSEDVRKFDDLTNQEIDAIKAYHDDVTSGFSNAENKTVTIVDYTTKSRHGLLANLAITQINNLELFKFDNSIRKLNKSIELVGIHTDCLGYRFKDDDHKIPNNLIDKIAGKFKIQYPERKKYTNDSSKCLLSWDRSMDGMAKLKIECKRPKLKILNKDKIYELIDEHESFILEGPPGVGKTYTVVEEIIPYLDDNDMMYVLCSMTLEQGYDLHKKMESKFGELDEKDEREVHNNIKELNRNIFKEKKIEKERNKKQNKLLGECTEYVYSFQGLFDRKSDSEIEDFFRGVKYLIIDEAVQLSETNMAKLELLTNKTNCKLIAMSDKYQCIVDEWHGQPYIDTPIAHKLFDYNSVKLKFHGNMRYDDGLKNIVKYILDHFDNEEKVYDYVEKHFESVNFPGKYVLAYRHIDLKEATRHGAKKTNTVHSAQGKTISEEYSLCRIRKMPIRVLYTAISRAKKKSQITLFDPDNIHYSDSGSDSDE